MRRRADWLVLALVLALLVSASYYRWRVAQLCKPAVELCPDP